MQILLGELLIKKFRSKFTQNELPSSMIFHRWNGVVGHTLYGDVDIGMCNIDITYGRYKVIDYSTFIRFDSKRNSFHTLKSNIF